MTKASPLVVLEAIKIEPVLIAPVSGVVAKSKPRLGVQVSEGALLLCIEEVGVYGEIARRSIKLSRLAASDR